MKKVMSLILSMVSGASLAANTDTPLKHAFQQSRAEKNIDLVRPVFLKSELFVVSNSNEKGEFDFLFQKSEKSGRLTVTVAEKEEYLSTVKYPKQKTTGLKLIADLPKEAEITVVYSDGGDYLTQEHLTWYREQENIKPTSKALSENVAVISKPEAANSASDWKYLYFYGISKSAPELADLPQQMVASLLSMQKIDSALSTGALVEPEYLFNAKGVGAWLAMYALVSLKNEAALNSLKSEGGVLFVPSQYVHNALGKNNNWPKDMLARHEITLKGYHLFVLPIVVPSNKSSYTKMSQSLKSPDGKLEIMGIAEFDEKKPEGLLVEIAENIKFIKKERSDLIVK
jgi:fimbrial chaperone protein